MSEVLYILQNPRLMASMFAGQIPAVVIFFGIAHLVLRKYIKVEIRSWLALTYMALTIFILTLLAWDIRVKGHGAGLMLLGPLVLSIVSCCGLYYHEWKRQRDNASNAGTKGQLQSDLRAESNLSISADVMLNSNSPVPNKSRNRRARDNWASVLVGLAMVCVAALWVGWPGISSIWNKPNYIIEDAGEYGYKQLDNRAADQSVRVFRYAGVHNGKHQVYEQDSNGNIKFAYECAAPCKAIKTLTYFAGGYFLGASFIAADADSAEARVMEDAINGYLKVQPSNSAALKFYRVHIETGMNGVPIRPVFSEEGIAFQYMAEAPADKPAALPVATQPIAEERPNSSKLNTEESDRGRIRSYRNPFDTEEAQAIRDRAYGPRTKNKDAFAYMAEAPAPKAGALPAATQPIAEERPNSSKLNTEEDVAKRKADLENFIVQQRAQGLTLDEERAIQKLTAAHSDWLKLMSSPEFSYWLDNVITDREKLMASNDSDYIALRLSAFKQWRSEMNR